MAVKVFFEVGAAGAEKHKGLIKKAAEKTLGENFSGGTVNVIFVGKAGIIGLNKRFLGRDKITDVISFNSPAVPVCDKRRKPVLGELYICVPQALSQAKAMGHSLLSELLILTVHGALHLNGMDDSTGELRLAMNRKTAEILHGL